MFRTEDGYGSITGPEAIVTGLVYRPQANSYTVHQKRPQPLNVDPSKLNIHIHCHIWCYIICAAEEAWLNKLRKVPAERFAESVIRRIKKKRNTINSDTKNYIYSHPVGPVSCPYYKTKCCGYCIKSQGDCLGGIRLGLLNFRFIRPLSSLNNIINLKWHR
jgi:hypothetical protein